MKPKIFSKTPMKISVEVGKKYFWCSCGLSSKQPFCDGSHKETGMKSVVFEATKNEDIYFCCCKQSSNGVFCDNTHSKL